MIHDYFTILHKNDSKYYFEYQIIIFQKTIKSFKEVTYFSKKMFPNLNKLFSNKTYNNKSYKNEIKFIQNELHFFKFLFRFYEKPVIQKFNTLISEINYH
jgi:hypothetical protein